MTRFVISHINLRVKNGVFSKMFGRLMQKDSSVHTIRYNIYHMVGRSIASISDLGGIFTSALCASVNMAARVGYIGKGPPDHTIYITYNALTIRSPGCRTYVHTLKEHSDLDTCTCSAFESLQKYKRSNHRLHNPTTTHTYTTPKDTQPRLYVEIRGI